MSNQPIIRQTAWISLIPHLIFLVLLFLFYRFIGFENFWGFNSFTFLGAISYLILSYSLRYFIPKYHRIGLKLTKQENFEEAIKYHGKSVAFFEKLSRKWDSNFCIEDAKFNYIKD